MIQSAILAALNHLVAQSGWAKARFAPFAGRRAILAMPPWQLSLAVTGDGRFEAAEAGSADVTVELPADGPLLALQGIERVLAEAHVSGNAEFATALSFVFRHLRWDAEEDLSKLVGDMAARRLANGAEALLRWQKETAVRLSGNLSEYLTEEAALAVPGREIADFSRDVAELRDDVARVEQRLGRLAAG